MLSRTTLRAVVPEHFAEKRQVLVPMSALSIALVVSIERFRDLGLTWVVTAVIGGSIVTEVIVSFRDDKTEDAPPAAPDPVDELDEQREHQPGVKS
jgi:hypothetical protein